MSRSRGSVLLGFGILAISVGIGVGVRPVASGGWGWRGFVGVALVLGGSVLAYTGMRVLTTGFRPVAAASTRAGLLLLAVLFVWILVPAVVATAVPPTPRDESLLRAVGLAARPVNYPGGDGVQLAAWYLPPQDGAIVIIRHGSGANATSVLRHAAMLAAHGYGLLISDARGHGESTGPAMDFGWFGEDDITSSLDFLVARPEVDDDRIAVLGLSMGGEEALGAIGVDDRVAAVVAEGVTARIAADKQWLSGVYGWRGQAQEWLEIAQYAVADLLSPASPPRALVDSVASAAPRPVLLIVAGDVSDESHAAEHIASSSSNVEVWIVPGAAHIGGLAAEPAGYEREVVGFLDRVLSP